MKLKLTIWLPDEWGPFMPSPETRAAWIREAIASQLTVEGMRDDLRNLGIVNRRTDSHLCASIHHSTEAGGPQ